MEEVAGWSVKRKVFHAQMLGAYHEFKQEQVDAEQPRHNYDTDMPSGQSMAQSHQSMAQSASPSGGGGRASHPAAARHETSWTFDDDDTDWQFCSQCNGLFEPGEYEQHFEMNDFPCSAAE